MINEKGQVKESVIAILTKEGGEKIVINDKKGFNVIGIVRDNFGNIKNILKGKNIVSNDGDLFYAEMAAGEAPTYDFASCVLGTGTVAADKADDYDDVTPIAGSNKAPSAGYPKTNDTDEDNTGKAVDSVTYKYYWLGADFNNAAIAEGCITIAAPGAGSKVLTRFLFAASFEKTASDTLTVYINHNFLGV